VPELEPYLYSLWRVVPDIQRGESMNAGVILYCKRKQFLKALVELDASRLALLAPGFDPAPVREHLELRKKIALGDPTAGPIALLPISPRFGWLVAPASTIIQISPVHTGLTSDPEGQLQNLFETLVLPRK
jgi:hypothetical protein